MAQADKNSKYKFELDVSSAASDFAQQSGEYVLVREGEEGGEEGGEKGGEEASVDTTARCNV